MKFHADKKERNILVNRIMTPDGTILTSRTTHDYVSYVDKNGEKYVVDGGSDYLRRSSNKIPAKEMSIYDDDDFETIRTNFHRYNPVIEDYVIICDIDNEWLENIITYYREKGYDDSDLPLWIFIKEHRYRELNKIT